MDFYSAYLQAATAKKIANMECSPELLIPNRYVYDFQSSSFDLGNNFTLEAFLHCLAGGNVHCTQLFSFTYEPLPCGLLLYTKNGLGTIKCSGNTIECKESHLLLFDCRQPFSLETCQETYGINKYRICREFSAYFNDPPLRYLNRVRIEKAKEMLLNTDLTVHEISSKTGFENVNHFINLFKRNTGHTPNVFRNRSEIY